MASTNSIFSADLKKYAPKKQAIFTLNRFNFDVAHSLLIPRAVGYSAGLINYFFRGKMDWEEDLANLGRFVVKNGSDERMAGELSLHYDLDDGQRNRVTGFATSVNVDPQVETAVTIPVGFIKESPERFDNETYMLVFKGTLGEEKPQGDSPGAVLGKQVRIRNVFDIYDTLYRPWSNYPKGFIWFYFDWEEQGSAEIREALQSALRASRVAINGHKLTPLEYSNGDRVGYVATSDFYAQISLSSVPSTRYSQTNYLYIQNVDPSGIVEVTVDERIIARFDWQSVNDSFFRYSKPFRVR